MVKKENKKKAGNIFCTSDQTAQKIIPLENQKE